MKFHNFVSIDLANIQFMKLQKKENLKYFKIKYNKLDFIIETCILEYVSYIYNDEENIYILKFVINDKHFQDFITDLNKRIIEYITSEKDIIFKHNFKDSDIHNLFFSNLEIVNDIPYLNIKTNSLSILNNYNKGDKFKMLINILGAWIYEEMFGVTFELKKTL